MRGSSVKHCLWVHNEFEVKSFMNKFMNKLQAHARTHSRTHPPTPEALLRDAVPRAPRGAVLDSLLSSLVKEMRGVGGRSSCVGTEGMGGERTPPVWPIPADKDTSSFLPLGRVSAGLTAGCCSSAPRRRRRLHQDESLWPIRTHRLRLSAGDRQLLWPGPCSRAGAAKGLERSTGRRLTRWRHDIRNI